MLDYCVRVGRYFRVVLLVGVCLVLIDFWLDVVSCSLGFLGLVGCSSLVWVVQICGVISVLVADGFVMLDLGCCGLLYLGGVAWLVVLFGGLHACFQVCGWLFGCCVVRGLVVWCLI